MKITIVSTINISGIPSLRYFIKLFSKEFSASIDVMDVQIKNVNSYYGNLSNVKFDPVFSRDKLNVESSINEMNMLNRYFKLAKKIKKSYQQNDSLLFTYEYTVLLIALILKVVYGKGTKLIYHQYELVDIGVLHQKVRKILFKWTRSLSSKIDLAIFPEIKRCEYYVNNSTLDPLKTIVIPNSCEINEHISDDNEIKIPQGKVVVGHVGNIGLERHYFNEILEVIDSLKNNDRYYFIFIGLKSSELDEKLKNLEFKNAIFLPAVSHELLNEYYRRIDLGIILYKGIDLNYEFCAPNKLYEYWSYGIPVIASILGGLKLIFKNDFQGILLNFDNRKEVMAYLNSFSPSNEKSRELKEYFDKHFRMQIHMNNLRERINELLLEK